MCDEKGVLSNCSNPPATPMTHVVVRVPQSSAECLQLIYHASLKNGRLPAEWQLAHVTPVHKAGSKELPNNYRPISLTSVPCKMLEHIVLHYLNKTLDTVLHYRQHVFCKGMSCDTQLCSTYHDLAKTHDESLSMHAIVLDFKKASRKSLTPSCFKNCVKSQ